VPYFTRQITPNGLLMVIAYVGVSQGRRIALQGAKSPIPDVQKVDGLLDTGATCTCIDPSVLDQLGLAPTGSTTVNTPTTGDTPAVANQYDVSVMIPAGPGHAPLIQQTVPVIKSWLLPKQGFHALIGLDILRGCHLTYDGQNGLFTLAY